MPWAWPTAEQVAEVFTKGIFALPCLASVVCLYGFAYHAGKARRYEEIPRLHPGSDLHRDLMGMEDKEIPYAAVAGFVQPSDGQTPLEVDGVRCIATETTHKEYRSHRASYKKYTVAERTQGEFEVLPSFYLSGSRQLSESDDKDDGLVAVKADMDDVMPTLETIDNRYFTGYRPSPNVLFAPTELIGHQTIVKALAVGRFLTVIGRISIENGQLQVSVPTPPTFTDEFIIINKSLDELIASHLATASKFKMVGGLCIGGLLLLAIIMDVVRIRAEKKTAAQQEKVTLKGSNVHQTHTGIGSCVICHDEPRSVTALECGHLCVCATCSHQLTQCPVCHQTISRTVNTFL